MQCAADNQNKLHERKLLMKEGNKSAANIPGRELIITRVFDAPRDLVFNAWTDPKHVAQWWGPERLHEDDP